MPERRYDGAKLQGLSNAQKDKSDFVLKGVTRKGKSAAQKIFYFKVKSGSTVKQVEEARSRYLKRVEYEEHQQKHQELKDVRDVQRELDSRKRKRSLDESGRRLEDALARKKDVETAADISVEVSRASMDSRVTSLKKGIARSESLRFGRSKPRTSRRRRAPTGRRTLARSSAAARTRRTRRTRRNTRCCCRTSPTRTRWTRTRWSRTDRW
eukprot:TRINITY_DN2497_c0_g1_i2.p2 TRINITY_DN2497_c0_g1~~TRINITY_DN2497_c0_g1_i2.p2  ORF type:complete len:211 (+),score=1.76 TRINITY_DN2497_c0_g1_i2:203-835(+)